MNRETNHIRGGEGGGGKVNSPTLMYASATLDVEHAGELVLGAVLGTSQPKVRVQQADNAAKTGICVIRYINTSTKTRGGGG